MIHSKRVFFLFFALVLGAAALVAQNVGTVRGTVLDPSGAAVPKATVTLTGPNNVVKVGTTDDNGAYAIAGVPPGKYTVRVIALGFNVLEKAGVDVPAGRPLQFDAHLALESSKQQVTVTDTQTVELDPAKNAGALVLKQEDLDMLSDDPDDLQADLLALAGPAAGPNGGQIFIDGFSNGQLPPKESIREIRINSNPFSAEYDTQGRGRIEIFTKPGTEKYHGSVTLTYSDHLFDARNPFITSPAFPVPASDSKNLQANLSGPIIKGKMSFFVDFSRREQRLDDLINSVVLDPATGFTPLSQGYAVIAPNTFNAVSPRITYQLTPNITLDGRYSWHGQNWQNQGIGGFNLPSSADTQHQNNNQINLTETQVINASIINESRFQYYRQRNDQVGVDPELNLSVAEGFTTGSTFPLNHTYQDSYEFQNYTSITHGKHFIKFGARIRGAELNSYTTNNFLGQFTFDSIQSYQTLLLGIQQNLPLQTIFASGGAPSQFQFNYGTPQITGSQVDAGLFYQDDWKIIPSLTLSLGLRYEVQDNIPDHGDWAPRVGVAWGIGPSQGRLRAPKTVLRAGIGYFYDRFSLASYLRTQQYSFTNPLQYAYTITDPQFFLYNTSVTGSAPYLSLNSNCSKIGLAGCLGDLGGQANVTEACLVAGNCPTVNATLAATGRQSYVLDSAFQSPRLQQAAIGIDRQLPRNIQLSVNYINSRGTHALRNGVNINTPIPGTYLGPGTGLYPYGTNSGVLYDIQSDGYYKQSQLITNINARVNSRISLFGFYAYGHADTNVLGSPSNPYNFNADWGRANYDIRHRVNINGSILGLWGIRLSPNISYNSAPPWNLYEGVDQFGDASIGSARPAFEPAGYTGAGYNVACTAGVLQKLQPCVASTAYGNFIANPPAAAGLKTIPINYFSAFGQFNFNLRISRTWGFGESTTSQNQRQGRGGGPGGPGGGFGRGVGGPPGGGGGGGRGGPGGGPGGPGGMFGGDSSGKRYTLTAGLMFHNMFNTDNKGQIEGDLLSPRLGEPLGLNAIGGMGFGQAFNRRIDLSLRFSF